jgi:hypothetical protein
MWTARRKPSDPMIRSMSPAHITQTQLEAALTALQTPGRFDTAERLLAQIAPGLQGILNEALRTGGWHEGSSAEQIERALFGADSKQARETLANMLVEETRLAMLVGVAVGIELARELRLDEPDDDEDAAVGNDEPVDPAGPALQVDHHTTLRSKP